MEAQCRILRPIRDNIHIPTSDLHDLIGAIQTFSYKSSGSDTQAPGVAVCCSWVFLVSILILVFRNNNDWFLAPFTGKLMKEIQCIWIMNMHVLVTWLWPTFRGIDWFTATTKFVHCTLCVFNKYLFIFIFIEYAQCAVNKFSRYGQSINSPKSRSKSSRVLQYWM